MQPGARTRSPFCQHFPGYGLGCAETDRLIVIWEKRVGVDTSLKLISRVDSIWLYIFQR